MIGGIVLNDETRWLYERLTQLARSLNAEFYGFDLHGDRAGFPVTRRTATIMARSDPSFICTGALPSGKS